MRLGKEIETIKRSVRLCVCEWVLVMQIFISWKIREKIVFSIISGKMFCPNVHLPKQNKTSSRLFAILLFLFSTWRIHLWLKFVWLSFVEIPFLSFKHKKKNTIPASISLKKPMDQLSDSSHLNLFCSATLKGVRLERTIIDNLQQHSTWLKLWIHSHGFREPGYIPAWPHFPPVKGVTFIWSQNWNKNKSRK